MDFGEALKALKDLESVPVAVDTLITRPAGEWKEEDLHSTASGYLALHEPGPSSDRPVDEAAWWVRQRDKVSFRLLPDGPGDRGPIWI